MMGRTHVVLGASAGALCALAVHPFTTPGVAILCIPIAAVFGPGPTLITRLGAGDQVAFATVSAADTITSNDILADVPAAGRAS